MTEVEGQDKALSVPCLTEQPILQPCICPCTQSMKAICRVCLEEDSIVNLTQPCSCSGSMQHVHKDCLQSWISEKGFKSCEVCWQEYQEDTADAWPSRRTWCLIAVMGFVVAYYSCSIYLRFFDSEQTH